LQFGQEISDSVHVKTFNQAHMRYSQYINWKMGKSGHLYAAVRYVENNSVRAGLVRRAEDYPWSSALSHVEGIKDPILSDDFPLLKEIADWREYLSISDNEVLVEELRRCTLTGRPSGDKSFVKRIEKQLDRSLLAQPRGRPRKKRKSK